jgi:hypothetical protein
MCWRCYRSAGSSHGGKRWLNLWTWLPSILYWRNPKSLLSFIQEKAEIPLICPSNIKTLLWPRLWVWNVALGRWEGPGWRGSTNYVLFKLVLNIFWLYGVLSNCFLPIHFPTFILYGKCVSLYVCGSLVTFESTWD